MPGFPCVDVVLYSKTGLEVRISRFEHTVKKATLLVEDYHSQQVTTCVLHDASSHNWMDNKECSEVGWQFFALRFAFRQRFKVHFLCLFVIISSFIAGLLLSGMSE